MDHPSEPISKPEPKPELEPEPHSTDYAPYPKLDSNDVAPPPDPLLSQPTSDPANPYVSASTSSSNKNVETVKEVLGKWGKMATEATNKAQNLAGNMWQHLRTNPNFADAAVSRISQQTKVLAEGGIENVYRHTFETQPEEHLQKWYACYLSTSAGPVMGTLYLSTVKLAFASDKPLSYQVDEKTEWSYYKMVLPLHQLKAVNPSTSKINPAEKYIQIITVDSHEFWFMGFVNYDSAVKNLQQVLQVQSS